MHIPAAIAMVFTAVVCSSLAAQSSCSYSWLPGAAMTGVDGTVIASVEWDPDGAGPATPVVVLAGTFQAAGDAMVANIVAWDPAASTWTPLGSGLNDTVRALAVTAGGDLLVGGDFDQAGGVTAGRVARWDGVTWSSLGFGVTPNARVHAIEIDASGDVFFAGVFSAAGGVAAKNIVRWDGANWFPLANGVNGQVLSLTAGNAGELYATGSFTGASGVLVNRVAVWDGSSWAALGNGLTATVRGSVLDASGNLVVLGPVRVWRWDGTSWGWLGNPPVYGGRALIRLSNGDILTVGYISGASIDGLLRFDGTSWIQIPGMFSQSNHILSLLELGNGDLLASGFFDSVSGTAVQGVARWNGSSWSAANAGTDGSSTLVEVMPNGDVVMAGYFESVDGVAAGGIARWDGVSWSDISNGLTRAVGLAASVSGDLYAIDSDTAYVWNGTAWTAIGSAAGSTASLRSICAPPDGSVIVGGDFTSVAGVAATRIARWNSGSWSSMGQGLPDRIQALDSDPNGRVLAAGWRFQGQLEPNRVWQWDGSNWEYLGEGVNTNSVIRDLAVLPNGNVVVAGAFQTADGAPARNVALWNGTSWQAMGFGLNGEVDCVQALPNGDVVVGGVMESTGIGVPLQHLARWDGSSWQSSGSVMSSLDFGGSAVRDLAFHPDGQLLVAGDLIGVDGVLSAGLARLGTSCAAQVVPFGAACASSGGANSLEARSRPWVGSRFECEGVGLPTTALIAIDGGLASSAPVPLASLSVPAALPGCFLHLVPSYLEFAVTTNGMASWSWPIPNDATFAGLDVFFQMVVLEVDPQLQIVESTSTNALQLKLGSF